jgi:hypothetical protein
MGISPLELHSISEIVRASLIVLVRLIHVEPGEWVDAEPPARVRSVVLRCVVEDVLKGEPLQQPGEPFAAVVKQKQTGSRVMDRLGLWSHRKVEAGTRLLAFCGGASNNLAELFAAESCELAVPEEALEDVRAAMAFEHRRERGPQLAEAARPLTRERGAVFARWLWARADPLGSPASFEAVMAAAEAADATPAFRSELLRIATVEVLQSPTAGPRRARLVRALLRVLTLPQAADLHGGIVSRDLPQVIGLGRGRLLRPKSVLRDPAELAAVQQVLRARPEPEAAELASWLSQVDAPAH